MHNGDCYPYDSYINHLYITPNISSYGYYYSPIQYVSPNSTLSGGEWVNPNGQPVNCTNSINNDPLLCDVFNIPANITVYRPAADNFHESDFGGNEFTITVNWTSPSSEDGNYVTYYNIFYSPSCPELSSINVTLFSVTPHQSITTFSCFLMMGE